MADYNSDKRLRQDNIEQKQDANASTGIIIAAIILIVGVIMAVYFYSRPVPVEGPAINNSNVPSNTVTNSPNATSTTPVNSTDNPNATSTTPANSTDNPTATSTTPANNTGNNVSQ